MTKNLRKKRRLARKSKQRNFDLQSNLIKLKRQNRLPELYGDSDPDKELRDYFIQHIIPKSDMLHRFYLEKGWNSMAVVSCWELFKQNSKDNAFADHINKKKLG